MGSIFENLIELLSDHGIEVFGDFGYTKGMVG